MLDPMPAVPPWLPMLQADLDAAPDSRVAQLATVTPAGLPEVRSVVVRGLGDAGGPWFASDLRSAKFGGGRSMELCLWIAPLHSQWRIGGAASVVGEGHDAPWSEIRHRSWNEADPQVRLHLTGSPPGTPLAREPRPGAPLPPELPERPPPHFVLARIVPERVERLVLDMPHRRTRWHLVDDGWDQRPVMP